MNGKSLTSGLKSKNCRRCWGRDRGCCPSWLGLAGRATGTSLDGGGRGKREEGRGWGCAAAGKATELSSTRLGLALHSAEPLLLLYHLFVLTHSHCLVLPVFQ